MDAEKEFRKLGKVSRGIKSLDAILTSFLRFMSKIRRSGKGESLSIRLLWKRIGKNWRG